MGRVSASCSTHYEKRLLSYSLASIVFGFPDSREKIRRIIQGTITIMVSGNTREQEKQQQNTSSSSESSGESEATGKSLFPHLCCFPTPSPDQDLLSLASHILIIIVMQSIKCVVVGDG